MCVCSAACSAAFIPEGGAIFLLWVLWVPAGIQTKPGFGRHHYGFFNQPMKFGIVFISELVFRLVSLLLLSDVCVHDVTVECCEAAARCRAEARQNYTLADLHFKTKANAERTAASGGLSPDKLMISSSI